MTLRITDNFNELAHYSDQNIDQVAYNEDPCTSMQTHHLVPEEAWNALAVLFPGQPLEVLAGGRNNPTNLMQLPATSGGALATGFALHNGSHPRYTAYVIEEMLNLAAAYEIADTYDPVQAKINFTLGVQELELSLRNKLNRNMPNEQLLLTSKDPFASQIPGGELAATIAMENMAERVNDVVSLVTGNPRAAYPNNSMANTYCETAKALTPAQVMEITRRMQELGVGKAPDGQTKPQITSPEDTKGFVDSKPPLIDQRSSSQLVIDTAKEHPINASMAAIGIGVLTTIGAAVGVESLAALSGLGETVSGFGMVPRAAAALGIIALTPEQARASEKVITTLPPQEQLNGPGDIMGPRSKVDHVDWRFTGLPAGDPGNTLAALKERDTSTTRPGGPLNDTGAHFLLRADGSLVHSDEYSRPLQSNPQVTPGYNANAVGVYVEGNGSLTPEQRKTLNGLSNELEGGSSLDKTSAPSRLMPASNPEREAWTLPQHKPANESAITPPHMIPRQAPQISRAQF